ncbi:uncharacterized protein LOC130927327 isoform X2 [Corythoichthys intestinalis]|uniref:uncharacterized protein LOC130927327 isoform X2 n=1 Tax=Corythoichthys intestinalis TaxID=161448 RepID=UPI0025A4F12B|nr:uncharacterized protein LOC130927327 isoform X2 [Corythoichthys intestinalis]
MSSRPHRGKYVSWNVDQSLPAVARPGPCPNKEVPPLVRVSALHGEISDEEDFETQSPDRCGHRSSSPVISRSESPGLRLEGWLRHPVGGKLRWAGKKHRGRGTGTSIAYWELEKENAHMLMVDLVLEMLEVIQWTETERMSFQPVRQQLNETEDHQLDQQTEIDSELTRLEVLSVSPDSCSWTSRGAAFPPE